MTADLQQITYTWKEASSGFAFGPTDTTLTVAELPFWHARIEHWLRTDPTGSPGFSHFYGTFRDQSVLVRRSQSGGVFGAEAHLLVGPARTLTPELALELRDWGWMREQGDMLEPLTADVVASHRAGLDSEARSPESLVLLVPLLSHVLNGEGLIVLPTSDRAYSVLWGLQAVMSRLMIDQPDRDWKLSFETYDDRPRPPRHPGLFVRFQKGAEKLSPHSRYDTVAERLVAKHVSKAGGSATHIPAPLTTLVPSGAPVFPPTSVRPVSPPSANGKQVICPICLATLNWGDLDLFRYDAIAGAYVELRIPPGTSDTRRAMMLRTAFVRCSDLEDQGSSHYLPLAYGQHGPPAVYGFVGATKSGKTHLLTAMIGQMEKAGLGLGLLHQPITLAAHKTLLDEQVSPFFNRSQVIDQTRPGTIGLVDAFLIREAEVEARPIALFDVAGGDLLEIESARRFLDVADGLIFVVNAAELGDDELGDRTFSTVLQLLQGSGRLPHVSAAIVLNKADLVRFDDPVALWMRHGDQTLDSEASRRESADVYAYLHAKGAQAWTRPYRDCRRATLHVASAAGSDAVMDKTFVRGVRPCRVLNPLLSLLAMTGVITSPEAKKIGI